MRIILFRHGIAEDQAPGQLDAVRRLTKEGVRRTLRAAKGLSRQIDAPDELLASPKLRAAETARILGSVFDLNPLFLDVLADGDAAAIKDAIDSRNVNSVLIVGHEPSLSELASLLCARNPIAARIKLGKAGAAMINVDSEGRGELQWILTPRILRRLDS